MCIIFESIKYNKQETIWKSREQIHVLLLQRNIVILWANYKKLSVNTTKGSHTIGLLYIQIDKHETLSLSKGGFESLLLKAKFAMTQPK